MKSEFLNKLIYALSETDNGCMALRIKAVETKPCDEQSARRSLDADPEKIISSMFQREPGTCFFNLLVDRDVLLTSLNNVFAKLQYDLANDIAGLFDIDVELTENGQGMPSGEPVTITITNDSGYHDVLTGVVGEAADTFTSNLISGTSSVVNFVNDGNVEDGETFEFDKLSWAVANGYDGANNEKLKIQIVAGGTNVAESANEDNFVELPAINLYGYEAGTLINKKLTDANNKATFSLFDPPLGSPIESSSGESAKGAGVPEDLFNGNIPTFYLQDYAGCPGDYLIAPHAALSWSVTDVNGLLVNLPFDTSGTFANPVVDSQDALLDAGIIDYSTGTGDNTGLTDCVHRAVNWHYIAVRDDHLTSITVSSGQAYVKYEIKPIGTGQLAAYNNY